MSPTSVATLSSLSTVTTPASTCPNCGVKVSQPHQDIPVDAQRRIEELEAQVKILTTKATAAGMRSAASGPGPATVYGAPYLTCTGS
jgi:hypothetical protein